MNYRERIRKAIECPQFRDEYYGEWGALNFTQRNLIKRLLNELDSADNCVKKLYLENQQLSEDIDIWNKKYNDMFDENKQLKDNWNKLKEYMIKEQARIVIENTDEDEFVYTDLLNKMQKLEGSDSNE